MSIGKPEVDFPGGEPPAELQVTDIWEGNGGTAKAGDTVQVHYVGVAYSTGEEFDASWDRGDPLEFQLGAGRVIAGWDQGVQGMKVGGRRQLIIPPDLAYGNRGAGNVIAPGETLIFVCDLVSRLTESPSAERPGAGYVPGAGTPTRPRGQPCGSSSPLRSRQPVRAGSRASYHRPPHPLSRWGLRLCRLPDLGRP